MSPLRFSRSLRPVFGARGRRPIAAFLAAAFLTWPAALHTGCEGGTTGVDNPGLAELPVEFRDQAGDMSLVQGTLEIYEKEHNPAVASEPLLRIAIPNLTGIRLTRGDFDGIETAHVSKAAAANEKRSAGPDGPDGLIRFNLVLRSASGSGAVATGLNYDPVRKVFSLDPGGSALVGATPAVRMSPKPLIRFAARIHREAVPGDPGRIFLPGTPFQATLVDSDFALQNLPEGRFGMRMLGGGGYVYAVRESLDTRTSRTFTADPDPIGRVDSAIAPSGFAVDAGDLLYATLQESTPLQGKLLGADSNDSRLSIVWRLLRASSIDTALIADPTRLNAQILFPTAGGYSLELSATLGATTVRDTVQFKVGAPAGQLSAKLFAPSPGESVRQGQPYKVSWDSPLSGRVRLEYSYKDGAEGTWLLAADSVIMVPGINPAMWTPPVLGTAVPCLLRVRMIPSDSLLVQIPAPFFLAP